jgi:hypothetical protein
MKWDQGRTTVERLLQARELERVTASRGRAERLITQATRHLATAAQSAETDPEGAYVLVYDAARKALVAILENEGLRPTSRGGHVAIVEAVRAQLDPPLGPLLRPIERMRRTRNALEYPSFDEPDVTAADVMEDLGQAAQVVRMATRVLEDDMAPF